MKSHWVWLGIIENYRESLETTRDGQVRGFHKSSQVKSLKQKLKSSQVKSRVEKKTLKSSPVKSQGCSSQVKSSQKLKKKSSSQVKSSQVKKQNGHIFSSKHPLSEVHESISFSLFLY